MWDEGLKLGHAVRTLREALNLAADDLDTATSLLSVRTVAGDEGLADELRAKALAQWGKRAKRWLGELSSRVAQRHEQAGEVAFLLEPDLKEGRGGLRDVHALRWAGAARSLLWDGDDAALDEAYDVLLGARVEVGRRAGRAGDRLLLQDQDAVAAALGDSDADALMARVAAAARTIAWRSDDAWRRIDASLVGPIGRLARRDKPTGDGLVLRDEEVHLSGAADRRDPSLALRAAAAAAAAGTCVHRASLEELSADPAVMPDPWDEASRAALVRLLLSGHAAVGVIEALDQLGLWVAMLPEWAPVRSRPQRNAYHRFTVDRHLVEAAANAAALAGSVARPDLLVVGALLHDIGKGYPGDHTEVGVELVATIGARMGFAPGDVATLQAMVRHHLLLADVATRRDLDDASTTMGVAAAVGDLGTLELLAALTEADSLATGPSAWGSWKAALVRELVARTGHVLRGGSPDEMAEDFPTEAQLRLVRDGREVIEASDDLLTVITADRAGLFSRVAGTLALHGLDVLGAQVATVEGRAVEVFRVAPARAASVDWPPVLDELARVLDGRVALRARLADRARVYASAPTAPVLAVRPEIRIDNDVTPEATVVEVHARDVVGVLYRMTRALAELDLDVTFAKVQTLGHQVVDVFYVRRGGAKVLDPALLVEVERALQHELAEPG